MHLISTLTAGVTGAESGHAVIRRRATATTATYYSSFEGDVHSTSGSNLVLDSNGRAEVYVNEVVDVLVYDSSGTLVVSFTEGVGAGNIEIRSASFTGTDYDDSGSAPSNPVTLQAIADLWKTNAGNSAGNSIDFKVTAGGVTKTLAQWMGIISGSIVFNVKDPTYGAEGDGVTDDAAAIQAAIDAANAAGGGVVYFPPGTYRTETFLNVSDGVSLVGSGPTASEITRDDATNGDVINIQAQTEHHSTISGLKITHSQASSGRVLDFGAQAADTIVSNCVLGSSSTTGIVVDGGSAAVQNVKLVDCSITYGGTTSDMISCPSHTSGRWTISRCVFTPPATGMAAAYVRGDLVDIRDCRFLNGTATSGTIAGYEASDTTIDSTISGCRFETSGGATCTCIVLGAYTNTSRFIESGNDFPSYSDSSSTAYSYTVPTTAGASVRLMTRETRSQYLSAAGGSAPALETDQYGLVVVTCTGSGAVVATGAGAPDGATGRVVFFDSASLSRTAGANDAATSVDGFKGQAQVTLGADSSYGFSYVAGVANSVRCLFVTHDSLQGAP